MKIKELIEILKELCIKSAFAEEILNTYLKFELVWNHQLKKRKKSFHKNNIIISELIKNIDIGVYELIYNRLISVCLNTSYISILL